MTTMNVIARIAAGLILMAVFSAPLSARGQTPEADSRAVIEEQLEAFSRDAWAEAYAHASPGVKRIFPTPEVFGEMVRNGYPMVWRPSDVRFLGSEIQGRYLVHRVRLVDGAGQAFVAQYAMERIGSDWKIAGVVIEAEGSSA